MATRQNTVFTHVVGGWGLLRRKRLAGGGGVLSEVTAVTSPGSRDRASVAETDGMVRRTRLPLSLQWSRQTSTEVVVVATLIASKTVFRKVLSMVVVH